VFEAEREEANLMQRKPRDPEERLFSLRMVGWSVLQGGMAFAMLAAVFLLSGYWGMPDADVRALTFFALIGAILALVLVNRSFDVSLRHAVVRGNIALRYVFGAVVAIAALILSIPPVRAMLNFGPLHALDIAIVGGSAALLLVLLEGSKLLELHSGPDWAKSLEGEGDAAGR
jgi:Ca2+-transporting ATPase